jgi:phosphatidylglycerophosphate synthase
MFDARLRPVIDGPLNAAGRRLARIGVTADLVTIGGMVIGLGGAAAIAQGAYWTGLALIVVNRLLDGLDGAIARATRQTDFGGYLDIVCDFVFYVSIPVAFGLVEPANLTPALLLVASFTLTGTSFLAFAALAAKRGIETSVHGPKSFFYNSGITEGAETIAVFIAMTLWPAQFGPIALIYAALCLATVIQRSLAARKLFC